MQSEQEETKAETLLNNISLSTKSQPVQDHTLNNLSNLQNNIISEICLICYEPRSAEEFLNLECSHIFCKFCLFRDWQTKIKSGYLDISLLKCPQDKCRKQISLEYLKPLLPEEFYSKIEQLCNENSAVLIPTEKPIRCLKCNIRFNVWKDADYFNCPKCKQCYCAKCSQEYEKHRGFTCEEFQNNKDKTVEEQEFFKSMKEQGFKQCPGCFTFVERAAGCSFIRCQSIKCKANNVCFCYLCGELIDAKEHYSHYVMSPWEGPCIKTAFKEKEKNKDGEDTKKKEEDDKFRDAVVCPGCLKLCKIDRGLNESGRFCWCENQQCKKYYCLLCKKEAKQEKFTQHETGQCQNDGGVCGIF